MQKFLTDIKVSGYVEPNKIKLGETELVDGKMVVSGKDVILPSEEGTLALQSSVDAVSAELERTKIQDDKALVTPTISGTWTIFNSSDEQVDTKTDKSITLETGFKASWAGTYKWTADSTKKYPSSASGMTTTLGGSGEEISISGAKVTSTKTYSQSISADKLGYEVKNNKVVKASGSDTTSASVSVTFKHRVFKGFSTSASLDEAGIEGLSSSLESGKSQTVTVKSESTEFYYYIYPSTLGDLTKITQNGATPVLGAFTKSTASITNAAGSTISLNVYRSNIPGAFPESSSLKFE